MEQESVNKELIPEMADINSLIIYVNENCDILPPSQRDRVAYMKIHRNWRFDSSPLPSPLQNTQTYLIY